MNKAIISRFFSHVAKTPTCHIWQGYLDPVGRGRFSIKNRKFLPHRVAYIIANGSIPKGKQINHHCDNGFCVNPDHLYAGSQKENCQDRENRGRSRDQSGEKSHFAKLSQNDVETIRNDFSFGQMSQREIAHEFGISEPQCSRIINFINWRK